MGSSVLHFTMQTDQTRQAGWQAAGRPGQAGNQANHMKYIICMFNFRIFFALFIGDFGPVSFSHSDEKGTP